MNETTTDRTFTAQADVMIMDDQVMTMIQEDLRRHLVNGLASAGYDASSEIIYTVVDRSDIDDETGERYKYWSVIAVVRAKEAQA